MAGGSVEAQEAGSISPQKKTPRFAEEATSAPSAPSPAVGTPRAGGVSFGVSFADASPILHSPPQRPQRLLQAAGGEAPGGDLPFHRLLLLVLASHTHWM